MKQPNPRELEEGISWEVARANEDGFFTLHEPWASLERQHRRRLGSVALAEHLSVLLSDLVSQKYVEIRAAHFFGTLIPSVWTSRLPEIKLNVNNLLSSVRNELKGLPVPTHADPRREVVTLIRDFARKVSNHVVGYPPPSFSFAKLSKDGLIHQLNGAYDIFRLSIHQTAPRFRPWMSSGHLSEPTPTSMTVNQMIELAAHDDAAGGSGMVLYLDEVMDLAKRFVSYGWHLMTARLQRKPETSVL